MRKQPHFSIQWQMRRYAQLIEKSFRIVLFCYFIQIAFNLWPLFGSAAFIPFPIRVAVILMRAQNIIINSMTSRMLGNWRLRNGAQNAKMLERAQIWAFYLILFENQKTLHTKRSNEMMWRFLVKSKMIFIFCAFVFFFFIPFRHRLRWSRCREKRTTQRERFKHE